MTTLTAVRSDENLLERLASSVSQLRTSAAWLELLAAQARFHEYSVGNVVLIHSQCPGATRVAGFRTWQTLGRQVMRGQRGIRIMAPVTRPDDGDDDHPVVVGFRGVAVFDISQTSGDPLPQVPCHALSQATSLELRDAMEAAVRAAGFALERADFSDTRNGETDPVRRAIRVRRDLEGAQYVKTLIHELAHGLMHAAPIRREQAELEAESVAFVCCARLGIDSADYSVAYIASWLAQEADPAHALCERGAAIRSTADSILEMLLRTQATAASHAWPQPGSLAALPADQRGEASRVDERQAGEAA